MGTPPLEPYYSDPLHDALDAVEDSVERWRDPQMTFWAPDACFMDPVAKMLNELEATIEGLTVPPPRPFDPPPIQPGPPAPIVYGSFDQHPPAPQEPWEKPWGMIEPPLAARPYFTHDGLTNRPYHPQFGGGTGISNNAGSSEKWCARDECTVDEAAECPSCDEFGDHDGDGDGVERCYFDWLEENREQDGANEGDEE